MPSLSNCALTTARISRWLAVAAAWICCAMPASAQSGPGSGSTDLVAVDDFHPVGPGPALYVRAPGVLGNDLGKPLYAVPVTEPVHAETFELSPDGSFVYTPKPGYAGPDSFTYSAVDAEGVVRTATVSLTIAVEDDPRLREHVVLGITADFGDGSESTLAVSRLIADWNPDFVVSLGDNNYETGAAETLDRNMGEPYGRWIFPYRGAYGPGAQDINRFFPLLGNHDVDTELGQPLLDFVSLPGNERHYSFTWGPIEFFVLSSDPREPAGVTADSPQALWLKEALAASTAPWRFVLMHHPPYVSRAWNTANLRWPFREWGADAVLAAHAHVYERLSVDGFPYFVNGVGGSGVSGFDAVDPASVFRYASGYGAQRITADACAAKIDFVPLSNPTSVADFLVLRKCETTKPMSVEDAYQGTEGLMLTVDAPGVLGNDLVLSLPETSARLVEAPAAAQHFRLYADGSFEYVPKPGFRGTDAFVYRAEANGRLSDETRVRITVGSADSFVGVCYLVADDSGSPYDSFTRLSADREQVIGPTGTLSIEAIAVEPFTGRVFATDGGTLGQLDRLTGAFQALGPAGTARGADGPVQLGDLDGLAFDPASGHLYASTYSSRSAYLVRLDPVTGTVVPNTFGTGRDYLRLQGLQSVADIAIHPSSGGLFVLSEQGGRSLLHTVDRITGQVLTTLPLGTARLEGLGFDGTGTLMASEGDDGSRVWIIDTATGATTLFARIGTGSNQDYEALDCHVPPTLSSDPGTGTTDPGTGTTDPGTGTTDPGTGTTDPGTGTTDPGTGTTDPGTGTTDPGTGTTDPGTGTTDPGTGTTDPGTGTTDPGTGTTDPGTGTADPGTGTTDPGATPFEAVCFLVADEAGAGSRDVLSRLLDRSEIVVGPTGTSDIEALAVEPSTGRIFATDGGTLGLIDPISAAFMALGPAGSAGGPEGVLSLTDLDGLAFDPVTGHLLATMFSSSTAHLVRLDAETGVVVPGAFGSGRDYLRLQGLSGVDDLSIHPQTGTLYVLSPGSGGSILSVVDRTSGAVTASVTVPVGDLEGMGFTDDGRLLASEGGSGSRVWTIDLATGGATLHARVGAGPNQDYESLDCRVRPSDGSTGGDSGDPGSGTTDPGTGTTDPGTGTTEPGTGTTDPGTGTTDPGTGTTDPGTGTTDPGTGTTDPGTGTTDPGTVPPLPAQVCYLVADELRVGTSEDVLVAVTKDTNVEVVIGPTGTLDVEAMAFDPFSRRLYVEDGAVLGVVDVNTGAETPIGPAGAARGAAGTLTIADVDGIFFDPHSGFLYGIARRASGADVFLRLDPATGSVWRDAFGAGVDYLRLTGDTGVHIDDMAIDPVDGTLLGVVSQSGKPSFLARIDRKTGKVTRLVTLDVDDVEGLTFDGDGTLIGSLGSSGRAIVLIDRKSGRTTIRTRLGSTGTRDYESIDCLTNHPNSISGRVSDPDVASTVSVGLYRDVDGDGVLQTERDVLLQSRAPDASGVARFVTASNGSFLVAALRTDLPGPRTAASVRVEGFGESTEVSLPQYVAATDVEASEVPDTVTLAPAWPNPFNPTTRIAWSLPNASHLRLSVHDLLGREVRILVNGAVAAGRHETTFDASGLPSGIYIVRLSAGSTVTTRTVTLVK